MGKKPRDIPEYSENSVHDLIKRDSTLSEMNQNAKNPKIEVGGVYGKLITAAGAIDVNVQYVKTPNAYIKK